MPSSQVKFLSVDEVLEIHATLIREFGGPPGVRDMGLLESALFRPRTGYYRDLMEMGAALFESLLMNHVFIDGNKRIAFFGADIFLRINGYKLDVEPADAHRTLIGLLERGEADKNSLEQFLRNYAVRR